MRHEPEVLRMAPALLPTVSAEVLRTALPRASEAANAGSSVWFAVVPRAQPSHVASLVHQFHIWATSEARRKELGLGSSLAAKVASDFH